MAACGSVRGVQDEDCDDCVQVVKDFKTVQVPCTRNVCKEYTVSVPRQVSEEVPRTVHYTDYEDRSKQVPYTVNRQEKRTRLEMKEYHVPVTSSHTKMVPVTKKVPKTIYVDVTTQVPQKYTTTTMETRERQIPVPYFVTIPEIKYRTVTKKVPVQRSKVEIVKVTKTVYENQIRTLCFPETKIVTKEIPVYTVVARPPPPCPPGTGCGEGEWHADFNRIGKEGDRTLNDAPAAVHAPDTNKDVQISQEEYKNAPAVGDPGNTVGQQSFASGDHVDQGQSYNSGQARVA